MIVMVRRVLVIIAALGVMALAKEFMDVIAAGQRTWAPTYALVATFCAPLAVTERDH